MSTRRRRPAGAAAIYLDVSGSMGDEVHRLHAAVVPLRRLLAAEVYVFSTTVERYTRDAFIRGRVQTTGGTDITPVLKHLTALATSGTVRRALVLTDGYVGTPSKAVQRAFQTSAAVLHVGIVGHGTADRAPWAASVTRLDADRARR
jgi:predicted metal-dependent peptidase